MGNKRSRTRRGRDLPGLVYAGAIGLGLIGWLFGEGLFYAQPHPIHWAVGAVSALFGAGMGWFWTRCNRVR
jgi:hypothetical protein